MRDTTISELRADGPAGVTDALDPSFTATLAGGEVARARRVVLATGMEYRHLDLPGLAERWGDTVFNCPFCHGWENRERPLAVIGAGAIGTHQVASLTVT